MFFGWISSRVYEFGRTRSPYSVPEISNKWFVGLGGFLGEAFWQTHIWGSEEFDAWRKKVFVDLINEALNEYLGLDQDPYISLWKCPLSGKLLVDPVEATNPEGESNFYDRATWTANSQCDSQPAHRVKLLFAAQKIRLLNQCLKDFNNPPLALIKGITALIDGLNIDKLKKDALENLNSAITTWKGNPSTKCFIMEVDAIAKGECISKKNFKTLSEIQNLVSGGQAQ